MHHFATAYLAPVSYYAQLYAATEGARIEQWEHYVKQTYRNRCIIATAQGPFPGKSGVTQAIFYGIILKNQTGTGA